MTGRDDVVVPALAQLQLIDNGSMRRCIACEQTSSLHSNRSVALLQDKYRSD